MPPWPCAPPRVLSVSETVRARKRGARCAKRWGTFRADVTSSTGINSLVEFVAGRFERLSILVYAAASGVHRPFDQLTVRQLEWTFHLNVRAFFEVVQRFTSRMQTGSTIVALSSEGAVHAIPQYSLVGASKGA